MKGLLKTMATTLKSLISWDYRLKPQRSVSLYRTKIPSNFLFIFYLAPIICLSSSSRHGCDVLDLKSPLIVHVMSKATQYDTNDDKISMDLRPINVKSSQTSLHSYITWLKKLGLLKIRNLFFCNKN
jgi:hypothetical protein